MHTHIHKHTHVITPTQRIKCFSYFDETLLVGIGRAIHLWTRQTTARTCRLMLNVFHSPANVIFLFTKVTTKITSFVTSTMTSHMLVISWKEFYNIYLYNFLFLYISIDKVLFVCIYTNSTVHFVQRKQITFKNMSPTHLWLPVASNHSHLLRVHLKWKEEEKRKK